MIIPIQPWQPPAVSPEASADLRRRLANTRWPDEVTSGWEQGTARHCLRALVEYWQHDYDESAAAARLQALPHYRAHIDGCDIHFLHFKAPGRNGMPLLLLNGWPSSFWEFSKIAPMLAGAATMNTLQFDVVIPALPGFGFSSRPTAISQHDPVALFHRLMTEGLHNPRYVASGTDIGAGICTRLALAYPQAVRGIHVSAVVDPPGAASATDLGSTEQAYLAAVARWRDEEGAYQHLQSTRPQTVAYALHDSPAGLASWILEKYRYWGDAGGDLFSVFPREMLVDTLMLYWHTGTIASSMRLYHDVRHRRAPLRVSDRVTVPTAVCMWPRDLVVAPREWAERFYAVRQYAVQAHGGHFPAWEEPQRYADDLRRFCSQLTNEDQ